MPNIHREFPKILPKSSRVLSMAVILAKKRILAKAYPTQKFPRFDEFVTKVRRQKERSVYASASEMYFAAFFGRDAIEAAEDLLYKDPTFARDLIPLLASHQGTQYNLVTEEEPGRIHHEYRMSPKTYHETTGETLPPKVAEIYETLSKMWGGNEREMTYYGSVDATPLYIKLMTKYLGPERVNATLIEKKDETGMSTGLAWTEAGGDILFIEVALMPGKGQLILTGQLGDVMKESAQAAISYIRSRARSLGIEDKVFQKTDIHIHVPEGAVPKDGPSAGLAITTAVVSALTKIPVHRTVAMTGEITLRGRALEIGGVKEKVIAAHRAGIKTVILPKENKKDLEDVPKEVTKDLKFVFVTQLDEVLPVALTKSIQKKNEGSAHMMQRPQLQIPQVD